MKEKRRFNHIGPIFSMGIILESVVDVNEEDWRHFCNEFVKSESERERGWF